MTTAGDDARIKTHYQLCFQVQQRSLQAVAPTSAKKKASALFFPSLWCFLAFQSAQGSEYNTSAEGKSIVPSLLTWMCVHACVSVPVSVCVCAHQCGCLTEKTTAMSAPYNQRTISHPYKTRKNNTWNRRLRKVSNHSSNYLQPDKQRRPSVEAADCSKAFIRRRSGGNNGIIVLDDGCLSRRYLRRPANFCWHRARSAWQSRRCHVV